MEEEDERLSISNGERESQLTIFPVRQEDDQLVVRCVAENVVEGNPETVDTELTLDVLGEGTDRRGGYRERGSRGGEGEGEGEEMHVVGRGGGGGGGGGSGEHCVQECLLSQQ